MVGKDCPGYLGCDNAISIFHRFAKINVLDGKLVSVHFQIATGRWNITCSQNGTHFSCVLAARLSNRMVNC